MAGSRFQKFIGRGTALIAGICGVIFAATAGIKYKNNMQISKLAITGIVVNYVCSILLMMMSFCDMCVVKMFSGVWRADVIAIIILCSVMAISSICVLASQPRRNSNDPKTEKYYEILAKRDKAQETLDKAIKKAKADASLRSQAQEANLELAAIQQKLDDIAVVKPYTDPAQWGSLVLNLVFILTLVFSLRKESRQDIAAVATMQRGALKRDAVRKRG
jgi:hypothetical protein